MQKLQDSVFTILKTTSLSPAVFSYLKPTEDASDKTPLGGIFRDTKHGWLALGPKFCVVSLRSGLKVAAKTFGSSSSSIAVTSVVELPVPLTKHSQQLAISLEYDDGGMICFFNVNGSQLLHCIQIDAVITGLALCDEISSGPFAYFDGLIMAGTQRGEIIVIDMNNGVLLQALNEIIQGNGHLIKDERNSANVTYIPLKTLLKMENQGKLPTHNDHLAVLLNEDSFIDGQYIFHNPDGSIRMKAKRDHVRVTVLQYIPQLESLAVGYNFGAFQLWNVTDLGLEFTSQVNVECLPVTHFGFQEPCDDPRAFCYLWVVFSVLERFEENEFPLAVMYSLTYQGKRMLSDTKYLYQEFSTAAIRFQLELNAMERVHLVGGKCISCHTYSINTMLGEEGEDTMLNLCQLVWECWGEQSSSLSHHGMLLFDLDQWYKDQMPATYNLQSNTFMSTAWCADMGRDSLTLEMRLDPTSILPYSHATRLEEHFYPNSLQYSCVCLNTSEATTMHTVGIQRQIISSIAEAGPSCLMSPGRLYTACLSAGLLPLYRDNTADMSAEEQRKFLLSVALEARLSQFLKRCAQEWATGTHAGVGCSLMFLVEWCWRRAIELKENAKDLTGPLFTSAVMPDRNVIRCLDHCVQQLTQLTNLLDAMLTKCCNLVVPDALNEIEEKYKGIGTVSLYFQVVQWFLRVGLLPERPQPYTALPYPADQLCAIYKKRRAKLHRIEGENFAEGSDPTCMASPLLYVDQLIVNEFGDAVQKMWIKAGSECGGLYPAPSLGALLRVYLMLDVSDKHKHSLLLYLLLDYSLLYDDVRYEPVIRRLMQFPPMFGLSTTVVRATQAFWHLDHRDFHFALDQLQCLTGNTLTEWQHKVVLSSLLAQKKSQAALQYLHLRKPPPTRNRNRDSADLSGTHDQCEDWAACCDLYLARGLVFEALDVVRTCVTNAQDLDEKVHALTYFFKGCRSTGHLSKVLQITMLPLEEEVFIKYLKECNEAQTADILVMYYLQQSRYLEAEQYNRQMKLKGRYRETSRSMESVSESVALERDSARDLLVEVMCSSVCSVANRVAHCVGQDLDSRVTAPKPLSFYVKATSPKNTFTYKSSFIQDTIENASETWINKPSTRKGLKRALDIEHTPFICTPKLYKTKSYLSSEQKLSDASPAKRAKMDTTQTPSKQSAKNSNLSMQIAALLEMPDVTSPARKYDRPSTPHSILKNREAWSRAGEHSPAPEDDTGSDTDMETATNNSNSVDYTNKHLRFTIPTPTEVDPSPTPVAVDIHTPTETPLDSMEVGEKRNESPPKKFAAEQPKSRRSYKDTVRARKSLSLSANSTLSDDPNTSIESIADIPITLINPKYIDRRRSSRTPEPDSQQESDSEIIHQSYIDMNVGAGATRIDISDSSVDASYVPRTPQGRKSIRSAFNESTPIINRSRSITPERQGSPIVTQPHTSTLTRSRSRTPEISPRASPLPAILELPAQEQASESHPAATSYSINTRLRSRTRTPERIDKLSSPRLEAITESPTKLDEPSSPRTRSRSRTPEVEVQTQPSQLDSPRSLRSRSRTPERPMSPKKEITKSKMSLSRIVLEANTFSKSKTVEKMDTETVTEDTSGDVIKCTPVKPTKRAESLMDVTFSPIVNKSILQSSHESNISSAKNKTDDFSPDFKELPAFTSICELTEKSVLHSYHSSISDNTREVHQIHESEVKISAFTTINDDIGKSVLHSFDSTAASVQSDVPEPKSDLKANESELKSFNKSVLDNQSSLLTSDSDMELDKCWKAETEQDLRVIQKEKEKIVEIEREINEIEHEMSDECQVETDSSIDVEEEEEESEDDIDETTEQEDSVPGDEENNVICINDSSCEELQAPNNARIEIENVEVVHSEPMISGDIEIESEKNEHPMEEDIDKNNDPFNHTHMSMMTDDNSVEVSSHSVKLHYSEDSSDSPEMVTQSETVKDTPIEELHEMVKEVTTSSEIKSFGAPVDSDTVDVSDSSKRTLEEKEQSKISSILGKKLKEDNTVPKETLSEQNEMETDDKSVQNQMGIAEISSNKTNSSILTLQAETNKTGVVSNTDTQVSEIGNHKRTKRISTSSNKSPTDNVESIGNDSQNESRSRTTSSLKTSVKETDDEVNKESQLRTRRSSASKANIEKELESREMQVENPIVGTQTLSNKTTVEVSEKNIVNVTPKRKPRSRKPSEAKEETEMQIEDITDKPKTRSRRASMSSSKSVEKDMEAELQNLEDTPKTPESASQRRRNSKTPNTEMRKIITRRASRELAEPLEESLEELTPRRSGRRNKKDDDNASVASESSVKSNKSTVSEEDRSVKKGKKSILSTRTDLSVIPEVATEEGSNIEGSSNIVNEYAAGRRMTRNQRAVLQSWLEPSSPSISTSHVDDDKSEGRSTRAASDTTVTPKPARIGRRTSVDVIAGGPGDSSSPDTPARGRRASFARACEALHTPKSRRASTDLKRSETASGGSSPATSEAGSVTPSRRTTRRQSSQRD
ncbi:protein ELYS isoform X2 [Leptidea sinapis]|uniref:protein ELYS isoform X2 n=1 Tax=Leptidea sinapis TaxID=189913 RepID=UPI00213808D9|nr:protein ELYS isoform X2 [Leptidea sinapis]